MIFLLNLLYIIYKNRTYETYRWYNNNDNLQNIYF